MNFRISPPLDGVIANVGSLFGLKGKNKDNAEIEDANIIDYHHLAL
jgi:hypothetical protein